MLVKRNNHKINVKIQAFAIQHNTSSNITIDRICMKNSFWVFCISTYNLTKKT